MSNVQLDTTMLDKIIHDCPLHTVQVLNRLAFEAQGRAVQFCPVGETGFLHNSSFVDPATYAAMVAIIGFTADYAPYVELGTRFMGAQPYLTPAVETIAFKFNSGETWRELCT